MADLDTMNIKKHIPNLFTLGNLFCGTLATIYAVIGKFEYVALFVLIGIVLDFFDGFLARVLGVTGELGKQLDSLADMVTSGVVPGIVMFTLINKSGFINEQFFSNHADVTLTFLNNEDTNYYLSFVGFALTLAACYRLAKFNIDTRQSESFIGLPTPAMSLFVVALPLVEMSTNIEFVSELIKNNYFLIVVTLVLSYLMNANLPLFSLKFKTFGWKENAMKYELILTSIVMIVTLKFLAAPLIILVYILLSILNNMKAKES